jgi:hypothetical protein
VKWDEREGGRAKGSKEVPKDAMDEIDFRVGMIQHATVWHFYLRMRRILSRKKMVSGDPQWYNRHSKHRQQRCIRKTPTGSLVGDSISWPPSEEKGKPVRGRKEGKREVRTSTLRGRLWAEKERARPKSAILIPVFPTKRFWGLRSLGDG